MIKKTSEENSSFQTFGGRLRLENPDVFQLQIHEHPAGALPVMLTPHWADFEILILAEHPCSSVPAEALSLNLDRETWLEKSTIFRLEHEFTHYTTMRLFGNWLPKSAMFFSRRPMKR